LFINRYQAYKENKDINISCTTNLSIAREYGGGSRLLGEGIINFIYALEEYLDKQKSESDEILEMRILYKTLKDALKYPGLILAIKVDDIAELEGKKINKSEWEVPIYSLIKAEKLYIIPSSRPEDIKDENIIKLLSDDGKTYINKMLDEIKIKIEFEKQKDINKVWTESKDLTGNLRYIYLKNDEYYLEIRYDKRNNYILLKLNKLNISNGIIIDVVFYPKKCEIKYFNKDKITDELKDKINNIINEMINCFDENDKNKYPTFESFFTRL
jgi:hypothetical protein